MENSSKGSRGGSIDSLERDQRVLKDENGLSIKPKGLHEKRNAEDFYFGKLIGEGSFSTVYLAQDIHSKKEYAIKTCEKSHIKRERKTQSILREKEAMNILNNHQSPTAPFFVKLVYTFHCNTKLYFVMTYCKNGELLKWIKKKGNFDKRCAAFYAAEVLKALEHMHSLNLIHRDLKPENILLDDKMHIKISDFGSCKILENSSEVDQGRRSSFEGTPQYVSPEVLQGEKVTPASDLWALGCIIYQMMAGFPPFNNQTEYLIFRMIMKLEFSYPDDLDSEAKDLVSRLLVIDASERLGALDSEALYTSIRSHPFFDGTDFDTLHTQVPPKICDIPEEHDDNLWNGNFSPGLDSDALSRTEFPETFAAPKLHKNDIKYLLNLSKKEQENLLEEQRKNNPYHRFVNDNLILRQGIIQKRKGILAIWRRRMFLLTLGPRLYYVDPQTNLVKGEVPLNADTIPDPKDFKSFYINTKNRVYDLYDPNGTSHEWCQALEIIREHYFNAKR